MKAENLENAQLIARRFIDASKIAMRLNRGKSDIIPGGKESAAVRRASMDLTRALANLRKSDYE
jgi:hypothetical protein